VALNGSIAGAMVVVSAVFFGFAFLVKGFGKRKVGILVEE
jgi:hypothetical protein